MNNNQSSQSFWQLDKAKAAKVGQSNYITGDTSEVYKILSAAWKANQKQNGADTYYMSLHIINSDKSMAHVDIYYGNSEGERWSGENMINAIMLCANVPALSQSQGQYLEYNYDQKKDVVVNGLVAPELAGKKVGLFLADNFYFNENQGEVKRGGLNLFNVFDAETKQLPIEKANNQPANPEAFNTVTEAMIKYSAKSKEKAESEAAMNGQPLPQFNNQMTNQGAPQNNGVTYQRGTPAQQNNQPPTSMASDPVDDMDIPF